MARSKTCLVLTVTVFLVGCASFESRFTSQTGCPEEEIQVLKRTNNLLGNQSYTVACRGVRYYCTESFIEQQHSNLKCARDNKRKRTPSSADTDPKPESDSDSGEGKSERPLP